MKRFCLSLLMAVPICGLGAAAGWAQAPVVKDPTGTQNVVQPAGTELQVNGTNVLDGGLTCVGANQSGADAGAKFVACYNALPSTGGTIGMNLTAAQSFPTDVVSALTAKNVQVMWTQGQYTFSANTTWPRNFSHKLHQGVQWTAPTGVTVAIRGGFEAPPFTVFTWAGTGKFRFEGTGSVVFNAANQPKVNVAWWGMDCSGSATDGSAAVQAAADSLFRGGTLAGLHGYCVSNFPTLTNTGFELIIEGGGRWDVKTQIVTTPHLTIRGHGGGSASQLRQPAIWWDIFTDATFPSATVFVKQANAGHFRAEHVGFKSNRDAPVFQCLNGSATSFSHVMLQNTASTANADAIEIDGCFWQFFDDVITSTGGGALGAMNYDLKVTTASTQDTGLVFLNKVQMNGSGIRFGGNRAVTGILGNLVIENSTIENNVSGGAIIIDRSNNIAPQFVTIVALTDADSTSPAMIACTGTQTVALELRGWNIRHSETSKIVDDATCGNLQIAFSVDNGHLFTGKWSPGNGQARWKLTNYGAFDAKWLYSGGRFEPSWTPFATPKSIPSQNPADWGAYSFDVANPSITTGISAPDGSTTAGRFTCPSSTCIKFVDQNLTLAVGEKLVFGGQAKANGTTELRQEVFKIQFVAGCATADNGGGVTGVDDSNMAFENERKRAGSSVGWMSLSHITKIATSVSNPCTVRFVMANDSTRSPMDIWKPFLMQIPATVSDADVITAWRAGAFNNISTAAAANEIFTLPDQPLNAYSFKSRVATGTPPAVVVSTTKVANWNGDLLDGLDTASAATASTLATRDANADMTNRRYLVAGTDHVSGDYALSAGWGNTASVAVGMDSKDGAWRITVTSAGTGQAASPTVTLTFKNGAWGILPVCLINQQGGTGTRADVDVAPTTTTVVFTWVATPVATSTYVFAGHCIGTVN